MQKLEGLAVAPQDLGKKRKLREDEDDDKKLTALPAGNNHCCQGRKRKNNEKNKCSKSGSSPQELMDPQAFAGFTAHVNGASASIMRATRSSEDCHSLWRSHEASSS